MLAGMVNRIGEESVDSEAVDRRLASLSNFQAMLLRHALSFPSVRRVVYSTCSVHERENELVVHDVLQSTSNEFQLVAVLPTFPGRGESSTLLHADRCVRMTPRTSLTVGFFVACLERVDQAHPDHCPSSVEKSELGVQNVEDGTVSVSATSEIQTESDAVGDRRQSRKRKKSKKDVPEEEQVPDHCQFSSKSEFDGQNAEDVTTVCGSTTGEMPTESDAVRGRRKSRKRKKSKYEKSTKLECRELDAATVNEGSNAELDGSAQKSRSENISSVSEATTDGVETETVGEIKKSRRRKKSKREKAAKLAKLNCSDVDNAAELELLDRRQASSDPPPAIAVMKTERDAVADAKKITQT